MDNLDQLAEEIHSGNIKRGFWDKNEDGVVQERNFGEMCALITSEISEALEEHRAGRPGVWFKERKEAELSKPEGYHVELIDALIRILDTLRGTGCTNIQDVLELKLKYNETRAYKHGKAY